MESFEKANAPKDPADTPNQRRRAGFGAKALVAAQLALSALPSHAQSGMRAMEVPRDASWMQGLLESRRSAMEDEVEKGRGCIKYADGTISWLPEVQGRPDGLHLYRNIGAELKIAQEYSGERKIERIVLFHTHAVMSTRKELALGEGAIPFVPPSVEDVVPPNNHAAYEADARINMQLQTMGIERQMLLNVVLDGHGLWQYRPMTESDRLNNTGNSQEEIELSNLEKQMSSAREYVRALVRNTDATTIQKAIALLPKDRQQWLKMFEDTSTGQVGLEDEFIGTLLPLPGAGPALASVDSRIAALLIPSSHTKSFQEMSATAQEYAQKLEQRNREREDLPKTILAFERASVSTNFVLKQELPKLLSAYRAAHIHVTFETYEEALHKPSCLQP